MDYSMPGSPVLHYFLECSQIHMHWVRMPSNQLILCHPRFLLLSIFPSMGVLSNESVLHIRWPEYWSFSISSSFDFPDHRFDFLLDWLVWSPCSSRAYRVFSRSTIWKHVLLALNFLYGPTLTFIHDYWKNHSLIMWAFVSKVMSLLFTTLSNLGLKDFEPNLASMWDEYNCMVVWTFFCIALLLEWKLTFSRPVATAEFSKLAGILTAAL